MVQRYCNIACRWCHHDYFNHNGFTAISNRMFAEAVSRVIQVASATEAHVRLTGDGEPTMVGGDDLADLVVKLKAIPQVSQVNMTTNGVLLGKMSKFLCNAGMNNITVSLNSLSQQGYIEYAQCDRLSLVLKSIAEAYAVGLRLKINTIYWKYSDDEINDFEALSIQYNRMPIKFFDLLIHTDEDRKYYLPLSRLEEKLVTWGATFTEELWPYPKRIHNLPSGAVFEVKIAGLLNNCPNLNCTLRDICLEGCRHSIRIGLDGIMKPCGVRTDNTVDLFNADTKDADIWRALHDAGKVGYKNMKKNMKYIPLQTIVS